MTSPSPRSQPPPPAGRITAVEPGSLADAVGLRPGDDLLAVNGIPCEDVIDVQFYAAEDHVALTVLRGGEKLTLAGRRAEGQPLGLEFAHPTFDTDVRRCNNRCTFCFVLQMAPRMRPTLYIKDDDYRYSFLFGHYVTLTNLGDRDWARIQAQRLSPLYVSVHATDLALRRQILGNPHAPDVLAQIRALGRHHITVHTQLVIAPGLNDGPHMEHSVRDLAALWPTVESVSVVPVGLTRHHRYGLRTHTRAEAEAVLDACHRWQEDYLAQWGVRFVYPTDEWYLITGRDLPPLEAYDDLEDLRENGLGLVRHFLDEWETVRAEEVRAYMVGASHDSPPRKNHLTLVTATLFAPVLARAAAALSADTGARLDVVPIANTRLGENITVAGLMMAGDVIDQLAGRELGEVVVLPRIMFDHPDGISLDDVHPGQIAGALGRPVALADLMGDVLDVLTGHPTLTFAPEGGLLHPGSMGRGGGTVEKGL